MNSKFLKTIAYVFSISVIIFIVLTMADSDLEAIGIIKWCCLGLCGLVALIYLYLFVYCLIDNKKIDELADKIDQMNFQNNGEDVNIDECIALARNALIEFPGNEKIMLFLASVLYNAGYVRYGEYHLTDEEGYDVLDVKRHQTYGEWKEAISLYEKLLKTAEDEIGRAHV